MAPSSSGLGHLAFIQVIVGSTPTGVTITNLKLKIFTEDFFWNFEPKKCLTDSWLN